VHDANLSNNTSFGAVNDAVYLQGCYRAKQNNNMVNTTRRDVMFDTFAPMDSLQRMVDFRMRAATIDSILRVGATSFYGDTTGNQFDESKRAEIYLSGYRDATTDAVGAKITGQTYMYGYGGSDPAVQYTNLLFSILQKTAASTDYTNLSMVLTGNGVGIGNQNWNPITATHGDKTYLVFVPADSVTSDTLAWKYVGHDSLREGIMDSSGTLHWRDRGGAWNKFSSMGVGDVVGPGSAVDNAITRFSGATGKLVQNSTAYLDDSGILSLGTDTPLTLLTVKTTLPNGITVTKEATPAGTDSSVALGVTTGGGAINFTNKDGDATSIGMPTGADAIWIDGATAGVIVKSSSVSGGGIWVSGEAQSSYSGADSVAMIICNSAGDGQITLIGNSISTNATLKVSTADNEFSATGSARYYFDAYVRRHVHAGLTAANPGNQGDAALTTDINEVSTVSVANNGVTLPSAVAGIEIFIINNGANTLEIWPASGDNLGAGLNTATTLASGSNVTFVAYDATNWEIK
jgi:hypothetical protein